MKTLSADGALLKHKFSDFKTPWNCVVRFNESVLSSTDAFRLLSGNESSFKRCATFRAFTVSTAGSDHILNSKLLPFNSSLCHNAFDKKIPEREQKENN